MLLPALRHWHLLSLCLWCVCGFTPLLQHQHQMLQHQRAAPAFPGPFARRALGPLFSSGPSSPPSPPSPPMSPPPLIKTPKLPTLRDRLWLLETRSCLTTAELLGNVDAPSLDSATKGRAARPPKSRTDYTALLSKLDRKLLDMEQRSAGQIVLPSEESGALRERLVGARAAIQQRIEQGAGKVPAAGIKSKLSSLKSDVVDSVQGVQSDVERGVQKQGGRKDALDPAVYLRADGTVDWEGALAGSEAAKKFGNAVWARINGRDPSEGGGEGGGGGGAEHGGKRVVKVEETDVVRGLRENKERLEAGVKEVEAELNKVLAGVVAPTSTVGKVDLSLVTESKRKKIAELEGRAQRRRSEARLGQINYDLERIYVYLTTELEGAASEVPLNDRLAVAEYGLLESQVIGVNVVAADDIDEDVVQVLFDQVAEFKRRLGIDYALQGFTLNQDNLQKWAEDLVETSKDGLLFYGKGCKLLYNDFVYSLSLISKALRGVTLKSREVRVLRRTFKDVITFIPFVIILLIPLTPVGHVLVFGAIQRFFPDFFPSCFTESRQNLLNLFEQSNYQTINLEEGGRERVLRAGAGFFRTIGASIAGLWAGDGLAGVGQGLVPGDDDEDEA